MHTFEKSVVFCARNSILVKKMTKIFKKKRGEVVLYKLYKIDVVNFKISIVSHANLGDYVWILFEYLVNVHKIS